MKDGSLYVSTVPHSLSSSNAVNVSKNQPNYKFLKVWDPDSDMDKDDKKIGGPVAHYAFESLRLRKIMEENETTEEDRKILERECDVALCLSKSFF